MSQTLLPRSAVMKKAIRDAINNNFTELYTAQGGIFITNYGAVGDGVTDASGAINDAYDVMANRSGYQRGPIIIPPGRFVMNSANLVMDAVYVDLVGYGPGSQLHWTGGAGDAIKVAAGDVKLQNFQLYGTDVANSNGIHLSVDGNVKNYVEHVLLSNFAICLKILMFDQTVRDCEIQLGSSANQVGIFIGSNANATLIDAAEITGILGANTATGIVLTDNSKSRVQHSQVQFCDSGNIVIDDRSGVRNTSHDIVHNYLESNKAAALDLNIGGVARGVNVDHNYSNSNDLAHFSVKIGATVTDASFSRNRFNNFTQYAINNLGAGANSFSLRDNSVLAGSLIDSVVGAMEGFYGTPAIVKSALAAALTNSVTAGGTSDTIANYTDLTTYANDSAAIRNNIYQLARFQKLVSDKLIALGLM